MAAATLAAMESITLHSSTTPDARYALAMAFFILSIENPSVFPSRLMMCMPEVSMINNIGYVFYVIVPV